MTEPSGIRRTLSVKQWTDVFYKCVSSEVWSCMSVYKVNFIFKSQHTVCAVHMGPSACKIEQNVVWKWYILLKGDSCLKRNGIMGIYNNSTHVTVTYLSIFSPLSLFIQWPSVLQVQSNVIQVATRPVQSLQAAESGSHHLTPAAESHSLTFK